MPRAIVFQDRDLIPHPAYSLLLGFWTGRARIENLESPEF